MNKEQFLENESSLYNQLALEIGEEAREKNGIFLPEVGSEYQVGKGLMICGRAARLGEDDYTYDEYVTSPMAQVERIFGAEEQIEWAEEDRGCGDGYNPARSPFWRVIRKVSSGLYSEAYWYKHIIYNNLYRVSADNNPTDSLCYKQMEICSKLLVNEIKYFAPRAVLCLTGMCWAKEVLEAAGISVNNVSRTILWGDYAVSVVESDMTTFLISEHPQGKCEDAHVKAILEGLEDIL